MKKYFVRIIDDYGLFVCDDFVDELTDKTIETPCPDGFYWPKWDGEKWVEGGTPQVTDQTDITQTKIQIQSAVQSATTVTELKDALLLWLQSEVDK